VFDRASSMYVNNIKEQLDATIKNLLISKNQLKMFRAIFCPSSGAQNCDLQHVV
jgi:acetone carboxylase gamma subunit